uniref:Uncharacterized protein n=1 Tax=Eubacterium cellulosolvens (strain ATCC 43171 / JCM 9499 / 6) TaxID=633697 RepID=I5AVJ0_EUBC6
MRKNEYTSVEEFVSQYTGVWNPAEGHWLGLDFVYGGVEYRLQTGSMYNAEDTILEDGRLAKYGLYKKRALSGCYIKSKEKDYELLGEYADMNDLLKSRTIGNVPFEEVIMDENTELIGQD